MGRRRRLGAGRTTGAGWFPPTAPSRGRASRRGALPAPSPAPNCRENAGSFLRKGSTPPPRQLPPRSARTLGSHFRTRAPLGGEARPPPDTGPALSSLLCLVPPAAHHPGAFSRTRDTPRVAAAPAGLPLPPPP